VHGRDGVTRKKTERIPVKCMRNVTVPSQWPFGKVERPKRALEAAASGTQIVKAESSHQAPSIGATETETPNSLCPIPARAENSQRLLARIEITPPAMTESSK
jgi:hypothetical protein